MVCCSNMFPVTQAEGLHSAEEEDWMTKNVVVVELPKNACWYTSACAKVMDVAEHVGVAASKWIASTLLLCSAASLGKTVHCNSDSPRSRVRASSRGEWRGTRVPGFTALARRLIQVSGLVQHALHSKQHVFAPARCAACLPWPRVVVEV